MKNTSGATREKSLFWGWLRLEKLVIFCLLSTGQLPSDRKVVFINEEHKKLSYFWLENRRSVDLLLRIALMKQDLAGGERQRVFWKQQYEGTQGVIFVVDASSKDE